MVKNAATPKGGRGEKKEETGKAYQETHER